MDLESQFLAAKDRVMSLAKKPSNEVLLKIYALNKQALNGDIDVPQPGVFDFVGQAKYNAWEQLVGVAKEDAMKQYVELVESLFALQEAADADTDTEE